MQGILYYGTYQSRQIYLAYVYLLCHNKSNSFFTDSCYAKDVFGRLWGCPHPPPSPEGRGDLIPSPFGRRLGWGKWQSIVHHCVTWVFKIEMPANTRYNKCKLAKKVTAQPIDRRVSIGCSFWEDALKMHELWSKKASWRPFRALQAITWVITKKDKRKRWAQKAVQKNSKKIIIIAY